VLAPWVGMDGTLCCADWVARGANPQSGGRLLRDRWFLVQSFGSSGLVGTVGPGPLGKWGIETIRHHLSELHRSVKEIFHWVIESYHP
jgi:hypothetical protein